MRRSGLQQGRTRARGALGKAVSIGVFTTSVVVGVVVVAPVTGAADEVDRARPTTAAADNSTSD